MDRANREAQMDDPDKDYVISKLMEICGFTKHQAEGMYHIVCIIALNVVSRHPSGQS